jgi:hypothetical protein
MHDMNTKKQSQPTSLAAPISAPVAPFTLEAFRGDIANVVVHYLRALGCIAGEAALSTPVTEAPFKVTNFSLFNPDNAAADLDLTYEYVRDTSFARLMEVLYEFAFYGRLDASAEAMAYESTYMWIAALLMDAREGHYAEEWDSYGAVIDVSAENCLHVAELANARHVLEGGEGFSFFSRRQGKVKDTDGTTLDDLSIRQVALLAGMEEMSVRAAANPKRANPLRTRNEDGRTRIACEDAKSWLQAKGRYLPVVRYWSAGEVDLKKRRFRDPYELLRALDARRASLATRPDATGLNEALASADVRLRQGPDGDFIDLDVVSRFEDADFMVRLAGLLELPAQWLVLRAREAVAAARLADVERELKALIQEAGQPSA